MYSLISIACIPYAADNGAKEKVIETDLRKMFFNQPGLSLDYTTFSMDDGEAKDDELRLLTLLHTAASTQILLDGAGRAMTMKGSIKGYIGSRMPISSNRAE
jgi:hypothetical protein